MLSTPTHCSSDSDYQYHYPHSSYHQLDMPEDPFISYAQALHAYTLALWTESRRLAEEKARTRSQAETAKKVKKAAQQAAAVQQYQEQLKHEEEEQREYVRQQKLLQQAKAKSEQLLLQQQQQTLQSGASVKLSGAGLNASVGGDPIGSSSRGSASWSVSTIIPPSSSSSSQSTPKSSSVTSTTAQ
jgi:hypothetical protein